MALSNRAFAFVDALLALIRQTKSNLQMALNYLEGLGYTCCAEKLKTSDYGVPQRRTRYYIFGISNKDKFAVSAKEIIKLIPARLTACMSVNSPIVLSLDSLTH